MIKESFKRAAATPVGEDAEARARRLAAERARLCRARARLEAKLNPPPPLTTEEVDMALSVHELSTALERAGLGDIGTALSLRCSHLEAYNKFTAAKEACARELVGIVDELSLTDIYALYPHDERPEYFVHAATRPPGVGDWARPEEHRCACGSSHRFQCRCDSSPIQLVVFLEREQNGDSTGYGCDQNRDHYEEQKQERAALDSEASGLRRASQSFTMPFHPTSSAIVQRDLLEREAGEASMELQALWHLQMQRALPSTFTSWWRGYRSEPAVHQKTLHLADRLLRAYPGILVRDSAQGMALYRRISTSHCCDLVCRR